MLLHLLAVAAGSGIVEALRLVLVAESWGKRRPMREPGTGYFAVTFRQGFVGKTGTKAGKDPRSR
jgi:hypothetical protein